MMTLEKPKLKKVLHLAYGAVAVAMHVKCEQRQQWHRTNLGFPSIITVLIFFNVHFFQYKETFSYKTGQ